MTLDRYWQHITGHTVANMPCYLDWTAQGNSVVTLCAICFDNEQHHVPRDVLRNPNLVHVTSCRLDIPEGGPNSFLLPEDEFYALHRMSQSDTRKESSTSMFFCPLTCHLGTERDKGITFILSLTSVLCGGGWLTPSPDIFTSGNYLVPLCWEAGGS
jgi:hypothetical protein